MKQTQVSTVGWAVVIVFWLYLIYGVTIMEFWYDENACENKFPYACGYT